MPVSKEQIKRPQAMTTTDLKNFLEAVPLTANTESTGKEHGDSKDGHSVTITTLHLLPNIPGLAYSLQIGTIALWYGTNGMNGIAIQFYAGHVLQASLQSFPSAYLRFLNTIALTSVITCLQLLWGALIGRGLLAVYSPGTSWSQIMSTHWWPLSGLHALGSLATNMGFMYGKASLVQIIKLLEPFETLILSQVLFQEGGCSTGIVSAMITVIGAAMSLLKLQTTPPHPFSVASAVLSGVTLSCRNVLQRKHHYRQDNIATGSAATTASTLQPTWSRLEKSLVQFTQLSLYSGVWTGLLAVVLYAIIQPPFVPCDIQVLLWHPLYNVFSMIVLGFSTALTHSLLNAGKRVFAICMTILWFHEGLNPATLAGLCFVGVGGSWYSWESKRNKAISTAATIPKGRGTAGRREHHKLVQAIGGLAFLRWFQNAQQ